MIRQALGMQITMLLAGAALPAETLCVPENRLFDGSFEASSGDPANSPFWLESSTNFVTPLCRYEYCGYGIGPVLPHEGFSWAWFGGALLPESATLSQVVTLPGAAEIELSFWLLHGPGTEPLTDTLSVKLDGVTLATFTESENADISHTLYTYSLDAFADGEAHTLLFDYLGPTPGVGSFSLDQVRVDVTACFPNLFSDGFEGGTTAAWSAAIP